MDSSQMISKVILCSHDRLDQNSDTGDCKFQIETINNVESFKLTRAIVPLSTYTFAEGEADSKLTIVNAGEYPNGKFILARYVNVLAVPAGTVFDPDSTFPSAGSGDTNALVRVQLASYRLLPDQRLTLEWDSRAGIQTSTIIHNTTQSNEYIKMSALRGYLQDAINAAMYSTYGTPYVYVNVRSSLDGLPGTQSGDVGQFLLVGTPPVDGQAYFYTNWNSNVQDPLLSATPGFRIKMANGTDPGVEIGSFYNGNSITQDGRQTVVATPLYPIIETNWRTHAMPSSVVLTRPEIITELNASPVFNGSFTWSLSENLQDPTWYQPAGRLVLSKVIGGAQPPWYDACYMYVLPNDILGFTGKELPTQGNTAVATPVKQWFHVATNRINLAFGITQLSIPITDADENTIYETVRGAISTLNMEFAVKVRYSDVVQANINTMPGSILNATGALGGRNYMYATRFKLAASPPFTYGGLTIDNDPIDVNTYSPQYWTSKFAAFQAPTAQSPPNAWCVGIDYYLHSIETTQVINFPTDTQMTLAQLQTYLSLITVSQIYGGLTASINTDSNTITVNSSSVSLYRIEPNHKLGFYDTTASGSDFLIQPLTARSTVHPIDLSSSNNCVHIGLNLYHNGRSSIGLPNSRDNFATRPIRRNIVATVHNIGSNMYGQHISYQNDSDVWLPAYVNDLHEMHVNLYGDRLAQLNLNKADFHLEIDVKHRPL